jgi:hypothetical protein
MCYYEIIRSVMCGHEEMRLFQYCHFARNDQNHQCFGAWNIKRVREQSEVRCTSCITGQPPVSVINSKKVIWADSLMGNA